MDVTLIGTIPRGHCLSALDEDQRRRLLAFVRREDAVKCIKYVATFRNRYGSWPDCDLSRTVPIEIEEKPDAKKRTVEYLEKFFYMIDYNDSTVDELCAVYNVPLLLVHSFDYNPNLSKNQIQVMLSAQHLNCEPDMYRYTSKLNQLLNIDFEH